MKYIFFDLDRTLIDSYNSEMETLKIAIREICGIEISQDYMKKLSTMPTNDFFNLIGIDVNSKEYLLINKKWDKLLKITPTKCFPKIKKLIKKLKNYNFFLGIITSRTKEEFNELDDELKDIINCFNIVITCDLVSRPKPFNDSFMYICNKYNIDLNSTMYVGDSSIDEKFAKNCNIQFIQATWDNEVLDDCINANTVEKLENLIFNNF